MPAWCCFVCQAASADIDAALHLEEGHPLLASLGRLGRDFQQVLEGSGECAEKGWVFLHLSIAGWTLVFFIAMIAASLALTRRD